MQSSKVVIPVGSERYIGSSQRVLNLQESVRMVVAVSMHFRAGCFSTCRVGMGHRSGLVGEGVAHIQVFIGGFNNRKLTGKITYRKQKADDSRSQTEKQIPADRAVPRGRQIPCLYPMT